MTAISICNALLNDYSGTCITFALKEIIYLNLPAHRSRLIRRTVQI